MLIIIITRRRCSRHERTTPMFIIVIQKIDMHLIDVNIMKSLGVTRKNRTTHEIVAGKSLLEI